MKEAAQACRLKLEDAIKQLRHFIQDISFAIDYEEKQKFLVEVCWLIIPKNGLVKRMGKSGKINRKWGQNEPYAKFIDLKTTGFLGFTGFLRIIFPFSGLTS